MRNVLKFLAIFFGLLIIASLSMICTAQNLILNGSFETGTIPTSSGLNAWKWQKAGGSPDYSHRLSTVMSGVNIPHHFAGDIPGANEGIACVGLCTWMANWDNFREYPCQKLEDSLIIGETYRISMYVLTEKVPTIYGGWVTSDFGVLFSTVKPKKGVNSVINWVPQVVEPSMLYASNWKQISYTFVADSAYKWITLGCFVDDITQTRHKTDSSWLYNCAYMFIDDVVLTPVITTGINEVEKEFANRKKLLYFNLLGQRVR